MFELRLIAKGLEARLGGALHVTLVHNIVTIFYYFTAGASSKGGAVSGGCGGRRGVTAARSAQPEDGGGTVFNTWPASSFSAADATAECPSAADTRQSPTHRHGTSARLVCSSLTHDTPSSVVVRRYRRPDNRQVSQRQ